MTDQGHCPGVPLTVAPSRCQASSDLVLSPSLISTVGPIRPTTAASIWHGSKDLIVPDNLTLLPRPPYSPECNPIERLWLYLRERFFSGQVWPDHDAIAQACCDAWNLIADDLERPKKLTLYSWAGGDYLETSEILRFGLSLDDAISAPAAETKIPELTVRAHWNIASRQRHDLAQAVRDREIRKLTLGRRHDQQRNRSRARPPSG